MRRKFGIGVMLGALAGGCGHDHRPGPESLSAIDPMALEDPQAWGIERQWQQRVTAVWKDRRESFEAVVLVTSTEVALLGLGPMSAVGFVLRWRDGTLSVENRTSQTIPFDPKWVLLDVQRVFFPWFGSERGVAGERETTRGQQRIVERWVDGDLVERRFYPADAGSEPDIVVHYRGSGYPAPAWAELEHHRLGYRLRIETATETSLGAAKPATGVETGS